MNSGRTSSSSSTNTNTNTSAQEKSIRDDSYSASTTLLTFLVAAVIALALSLGLPTFATQQLSSTCPLVNPHSGVAQSTYFLSLYNGFSSRQEQCINNNDDFCVSWSSPVWANFTQLAGVSYMKSADLKYASATQGLVYGGAALVVAALCAAFFALVLLSLLLCYKQLSQNCAFATFLFAAIFVFFAWLLSLGGIFSILFAAPFQDTAWTTFFRRGGTFASLISQSSPTTPTSSVASCQVSIPIVEGGALLATSVVLLFVIVVWSFCSACVIGNKMFEEQETSSSESCRDGRESVQSTHTHTHDLIPPPTSTASAPSSSNNPWAEQEGEEKTVAWAETGTTSRMI